jgi:hypothetical protein
MPLYYASRPNSAASLTDHEDQQDAALSTDASLFEISPPRVIRREQKVANSQPNEYPLLSPHSRPQLDETIEPPWSYLTASNNCINPVPRSANWASGGAFTCPSPYGSSEPWSHVSIGSFYAPPPTSTPGRYFDPIREARGLGTNSTRTISDDFASADMSEPSTVATSEILPCSVMSLQPVVEMSATRQASRRGSLTSTDSVYYDLDRRRYESSLYTSVASMSRSYEYKSSTTDIPLRQGSPSLSTVSVTPTSVPDVLCCQHGKCRKTFTGTYRRGNLQRHMRLKHSPSSKEEEREYACNATGCNKRFKRQDARLNHFRKHHPEIGAALPRSRK